ncbi:type ISP restriction/modification enzyme, partial [Spirulina sp.]
MSKLLVTQYQRQIEEFKRYGGSANESSIRGAFQVLLGEYCKTRDFRLIPELEYRDRKIRPDGTVKDALRLDWGYWESKDQYDDLDLEIEKKFAKGYPQDNIIFEDSQTAVLFQAGREQRRIAMADAAALDGLLQEFINYVRPEVKGFREALERFKEDVPAIASELRSRIAQASDNNPQFQTQRDTFLTLCQQSINPNVSLDDVTEMIIQHILSEDIFTNVFNEAQFHRDNNIARSLSGVIETFFTRSVRRDTLKSIEHYYAVIKRESVNIANHHEKQKFLKVIYENFYKAYNPKAADRLGIVYTPNEIVRFMIESTDFLLHRHFGKLLEDPGVDILDPATGTGTFITELIEYLNPHRLREKYCHEIHCNEVSILPYYIANLNIEFTYQQKMGDYHEFNNICLVDTLDHTAYHGKQMDLFAMTMENTKRINRQNDRDISVIIGNPPYNAWQDNFNDNNANRLYKSIDQRIKETYIKQGKAQNQIAVYDMYVRFMRWASSRIGKNGIISFVTNSSFIDGLTFDGFRKVVSEEFSDIYLVDLGADIRKNPKLSGTTHNVFGIQAGVAISFFVKKEGGTISDCRIHYVRRPDDETAEEKLSYLSSQKIQNLPFDHVRPDKKHNWINLTDNDFDELLPLIDKEVKAGRSEKAIFQLFSRGVATQRDEWVYDFSEESLTAKMKFFVKTYQATLKDPDYTDREKIKWDRELTKYLDRKIPKEFDKESIVISLYRPFTKENLYYDKHFNGMTYQWPIIYGRAFQNLCLALSGTGSSKPFQTLASDQIIGLDCLEKTQCLPLYRYDKNGNRHDNITDWALTRFREHYQPSPPAPLPQERGEISPRPVGEGWVRANVQSPSPAGEGFRERVDSEISELSYIVGARRSIPDVLLEKARELRKTETQAEKLLWQCLRNRQLNNFKFRRQHNIGQYIVDFYCHDAKLIIELDGGIHEQQKDRDRDRDDWLQAHGLKVLRLKNEEVIEGLGEALERIAWALEPSPPAPLPQERGEISPLPAGEGWVRADTHSPSPPAPLPQERGEISPRPQGEGWVRADTHSPFPPAPLPQERGEISPRPQGEGWVRADTHSPSPPAPLPQERGEI